MPEAAPSEERRLVTALFCDLVGFTPLSEQLDPEEVRDLQGEYFARMRDQIERYGGVVEKYAGDAVLALFGAPIAHEDDAERAVLCGLGMQEVIEPVAEKARQRWDVEPAIRVGVNTGEVVSGVWDTGSRQDVAVTGDAINTAARLQAAAESGEVLAGAETMRLTRRRIRYGPTRELVLKGKMGTVPAWPALGLREEFGERWEEREYVAPLVGRDREMLQLLDAWMRVQGGEGQLVTAIGDAGAGKSRLLAELVEKVSGNQAVRVVRARCLSYGQEISLWLVADLLRSIFGIREQDGLDEVRTKLRTAVPGILTGSDTETQAEALDVLGEALGLPAGGSLVANSGPQIRRQVLIRSLRRLLGAISERAPAILLLEDLHWIDEASQEVLREVLSDVPGLRFLVLTAQRPGWVAPWSDWGWTERVTLRPLRDEEAAVLAGAVLGGARLAQELQHYVADRAGGNPFFVEEMLRALRESGDLVERNGEMTLLPGAADRLPSTLTEVLLARLDRLGGPVRNVAQVASVIGRSFAVQLLAEVVEQDVTSLELPLTQLQQAEIAFPRRGSNLEYVFKHVSMRDVAYNTLVARRRQELHLQTARAIAILYPTDEYVEMIAYHFSRTEEHAEAASWLERAGDRAAAVYAMDTAIGNYSEARRRLETVGVEAQTTARLDEKLGSALVTAGRYDDSFEPLDQAAEVYRERRDLEAAGRVTAQIGIAHRFRGTPEEGIARVRPMIELLSWSGPSQALAQLHLALANLLFSTGSYRRMLGEAERAAEISRAIGDDRLLGEAEERRGTVLIVLGQPEEGRPTLEESLQLIESGGDLMVLSRALNNLGEACKISGDIEGARKYTERSAEMGERIGNQDWVSFILTNLGAILLIEGDWEGAREHLERAWAIAKRVGHPSTLAGPLLALGELAMRQGRREEAARLLEEGVALGRQASDRQMIENGETCLAELDLLGGKPDAAIARLAPLADREDANLGLMLPPLVWAYLDSGDVTRAADLAERTVERTRSQEQTYLVHALWIQARVLIRQERHDEARRALDEALALARSLPWPYMEGQLLVEESCLRQAREDATGAGESLEAALSIFRRLGAQADVEHVEGTPSPVR